MEGLGPDGASTRCVTEVGANVSKCVRNVFGTETCRNVEKRHTSFGTILIHFVRAGRLLWCLPGAVFP